ncbi:MAG: aminodeoxychorismate/anthranilate synthase component II [Saprospiraceae bacterium]
MRVLVLDNYDSFTYNLVQYIEELLEAPIDVFRNDKIDLAAVANYDVIILSPGPGVPSEAGIMPALLNRYKAEKIILGVCLGHQAIGESYGGEIYNLADVYHGIETAMVLTGEPSVLFEGIDDRFRAGRYHSWVVRKETLPDELAVTATDETGEIMAFRHREHEVFGVQFHPESIMTPTGRKMLANLFNHAADRLGRPRPTGQIAVR